MQHLTIITPTGDRPQAFGLCASYLARQTRKGPATWIVVDDGRQPLFREPNPHPFGMPIWEIPPPTDWPKDKRDNWTATYIREAPAAGMTLARNLMAALPHCREGIVAVVEDDDWYHPGYLERLERELEDREMAGEGCAHYYHAGNRCWRVHPNLAHASLCQTGWRTSLHDRFLPVVRGCQGTSHFVDIKLWREAPEGSRKVWAPELSGGPGLFKPLAVGMKGLPGRPGAGIGHRMAPASHEVDRDGKLLERWIGERDAMPYLALYAGNGGDIGGPG